MTSQVDDTFHYVGSAMKWSDCYGTHELRYVLQPQRVAGITEYKKQDLH